MRAGWIAAIAGYAAFGLAARDIVTGAEDSTIETGWYVPQGTEDYINEKVAEIQQEQKARIQAKLGMAVATGAGAMIGVGLLLTAWGAG